MAVGLPLKTTYANGDVYSASDVNDTNGTVNLVGQSLNFYAGKNAVINGNFGVWQRGTTFTGIATGAFSADRWSISKDKTTNITQQTFTPGAAPVAGYEGQFFLRQVISGGSFYALLNKIEDVRQYAGQTVTLSYWAKADASVTNTAGYAQNFGSGGSGQVAAYASNNTITTSWQRFTATFAIPSISGKTIGTSSFLAIQPILIQNSTTHTIDIWGVQLEAGSTATAFQTATGTIQGELAACQRYYWRSSGNAAANIYGVGISATTTAANICVVNPVTMRVVPTSIDYSTLGIGDTIGYNLAVSALSISHGGITSVYLSATNATGASTARTAFLQNKDSTAGYLGLNAEL